jgi:nuclear transcription Y subunit beta
MQEQSSVLRCAGCTELLMLKQFEHCETIWESNALGIFRLMPVFEISKIINKIRILKGIRMSQVLEILWVREALDKFQLQDESSSVVYLVDIHLFMEEEKEHDRYLPIANVSRLMKKGLPQNAKIAKDAKSCIQDCVSEFISFVTSEASDRCIAEKRKTINGEDIIWAMQNLGFDNYQEVLKVYLARYRQTTKEPEEEQFPPVWNPS